VNAPSKFVVERTGSSAPMVAVHIMGQVHFMTEDTALVLADALKQVALAEKKRLMVYEESATRPAALYSDGERPA